MIVEPTTMFTEWQVRIIVEGLRLKEEEWRRGFGHWVMERDVQEVGGENWLKYVAHTKACLDNLVALRAMLGDTKPVEVHWWKGR